MLIKHIVYEYTDPNYMSRIILYNRIVIESEISIISGNA